MVLIKFCVEQVYGGPILTPKYPLNAVNSCDTACFLDQYNIYPIKAHLKFHWSLKTDTPVQVTYIAGQHA